MFALASTASADEPGLRHFDRSRVHVSATAGLTPGELIPYPYAMAGMSARVYRFVHLEGGIGTGSVRGKYAGMIRLRPQLSMTPSFGFGLSHGPYHYSDADSLIFPSHEIELDADAVTWSNLELAFHIPAGRYLEVRLALGASVALTHDCHKSETHVGDTTETDRCDRGDLSGGYGNVSLVLGL